LRTVAPGCSDDGQATGSGVNGNCAHTGLPVARPIQARNGSWTVKVKAEDGAEKAIHSLYNPEAEAQGIVGSFPYDGAGVLVVLGLGLGYHVAELADRYPRAQIVVVEASDAIAALCARHGRSFAPSVRVISGKSADEAAALVLRCHLRSGMQPLAVFTLASSLAAFPSYYRPILHSLEKSIQAKLWDRLKYPKFREEKAHIGIVDFGYYLTSEIERALKRLGHHVTVVPIRKGQEGEQAVCAVMKVMSSHKPDFLLTINHLGFDEQGILTSFLNSVELPAAVWYVDNPKLILRDFPANVSPYVSVFVWDKGYLEDMRSMGFEHVHYLPLAADDEVFKPMELSLSDRRNYGADIAFVGNSMQEPVERWLEKVSPQFHPLVERLARVLSARRMSVASAARLTGDAKELERLAEPEKLDFEGAVLWCATLEYRLSCVKKLEQFNHRVHGDDGWRDLLGAGYRIYPRLNYYTEVPKLYNACRLNLNATNLQMETAVNQRVFDVPACAGLVLTDCQEALAELLEPEQECATYREAGEVAEAVRFYLKNPAAMRAIACKGRNRVLQEHTYKHRVERIIGLMRKAYGGWIPGVNGRDAVCVEPRAAEEAG
jgi:spore maturation protein CgeB